MAPKAKRQHVGGQSSGEGGWRGAPTPDELIVTFAAPVMASDLGDDFFTLRRHAAANPTYPCHITMHAGRVHGAPAWTTCTVRAKPPGAGESAPGGKKGAGKSAPAPAARLSGLPPASSPAFTEWAGTVQEYARSLVGYMADHGVKTDQLQLPQVMYQDKPVKGVPKTRSARHKRRSRTPRRLPGQAPWPGGSGAASSEEGKAKGKGAGEPAPGDGGAPKGAGDAAKGKGAAGDAAKGKGAGEPAPGGATKGAGETAPAPPPAPEPLKDLVMRCIRENKLEIVLETCGFQYLGDSAKDVGAPAAKVRQLMALQAFPSSDALMKDALAIMEVTPELVINCSRQMDDFQHLGKAFIVQQHFRGSDWNDRVKTLAEVLLAFGRANEKALRDSAHDKLSFNVFAWCGVGGHFLGRGGSWRVFCGGRRDRAADLGCISRFVSLDCRWAEESAPRPIMGG